MPTAQVCVHLIQFYGRPVGGMRWLNRRDPAPGTSKHRKFAPRDGGGAKSHRSRRAPDYEVIGAIIELFKKYPGACHHPKEDIIYEKFKARGPDRVASIADLEAEHREGAVRLRRVAQAIENVL